MTMRRWRWGPLAHAALVGITTVVAFIVTDNDIAAASVVAIFSPLWGRLIGLIGPRTLPVIPPAQARVLTPSVAEIERLVAELNGDVHDVVNLLAAMRGYLDFIKDALRESLKGLEATDATLRRGEEDRHDRSTS